MHIKDYIQFGKIDLVSLSQYAPEKVKKKKKESSGWWFSGWFGSGTEEEEEEEVDVVLDSDQEPGYFGLT